MEVMHVCAAPATFSTPHAAAADKLPPTEGIIETPFGPLTLDPERCISLPRGLPGFPEAERFQLDYLPGVEGDLKLLQSVDEPQLSFVVMPLAPGNPIIAAADIDQARETLGIPAADVIVVLVVAMCPGRTGIDMFVNLRAPLLIDVRRRIGAQIVLANSAYATRHPIMDGS